MRESPFSRRSVIILIACASALGAASVLLHAYGRDPVSNEKKFAPGAHSVSAIGHAGFYDLLRRLDRPVSRSSGNAVVTVGERGTLIVAEPDLRYVADTVDTWSKAPRLLLVLPKWQGKPDEKRPAWISEAEPVSLIAAQQTLALVAGMRGSVFRKELSDVEKVLPVNAVEVEPTLPDVVQLIRSEEMTPLVGGKDGMLLGEMEIEDSERKIWVLSDPDVMSNHGIVKGDNAAFMLAVVDALRFWNNTDPDAPVVFDETVHGYREHQSSPLKLLFSFPFVVVTALTCVAAALVLMSGTGRFGVPLEPKPALDFGKANLIGNSARLLDYAGHHAEVLKRYIRMTMHSVAFTLRAPRLSDSEDGDAALCEWLDQVGRSRGVSASCMDILLILRAAKASGAEGALPSLFECAEKIYDWKQEILNLN